MVMIDRAAIEHNPVDFLHCAYTFTKIASFVTAMLGLELGFCQVIFGLGLARAKRGKMCDQVYQLTYIKHCDRVFLQCRH